MELRTKVTSVLVFFLTLAFLRVTDSSISWSNTLLFFVSMLLFDCATTALNNYLDTKTNGLTLPFPRITAKRILFVLVGMSTALGLFLAWRTDAVVLLVGALCFACGILYTWGATPISRLPLGEVFSGLFYGLLIPFLLLQINHPGEILSLQADWHAVQIVLLLPALISLLLLSTGPVMATANIMLANNLCDLDRDVQVGRFTLPYYLKQAALPLFRCLYYFTYPAFTILVLWLKLSPLCLLYWLTLLPVERNIRRFCKLQDKTLTFPLAVKNYVLLIGSQTILLFASSFLL